MKTRPCGFLRETEITSQSDLFRSRQYQVQHSELEVSHLERNVIAGGIFSTQREYSVNNTVVRTTIEFTCLHCRILYHLLKPTGKFGTAVSTTVRLMGSMWVFPKRGMASLKKCTLASFVQRGLAGLCANHTRFLFFSVLYWQYVLSCKILACKLVSTLASMLVPRLA